MMGSYPVFCGDSQVGTVELTRQGLYGRIRCRCDLQGEGIYRLGMRIGAATENLGVCVPEEGMLCLDKQIPWKRLSGKPEFLLVAKPGGKFIPVYPDEPFAYMARLKDAFLARQADRLGIMLPE